MQRSNHSLISFLQCVAELKQIEVPNENDLQKTLMQVSSEHLRNKISSMHIEDVTLDSRQAHAKSVFVALKGSTLNGELFIQDALKRACYLVVRELEAATNSQHEKLFEVINNSGVEYLCCFVPDLKRHLSTIAKHIFKTADFPNITAVTGTNGKTSVANLLAQLASLCGVNSGVIGTLGVMYMVNGKSQWLSPTINTTPDQFTLCRHLNEASNNNIGFMAIEASSHGLAQSRLDSIESTCGIFTNLTQDHLDYHSTMQEYAQAKRSLIELKGLRYLVLNADDAESYHWAKNVPLDIQVAWFSTEPLKQDQQGTYLTSCKFTEKGSEISIRSQWGSANINLPLLGDFNIANYVATITALCLQGFAFDKLVEASKKLQGVKGRMELFSNPHASIIVDYAHTPDALLQLLRSTRRHVSGKLHVVFGCGGDRDKSKRALMGKVAQQYADKVVLTQDNSRTESPLDIITDIKKGIHELDKVEVVLDRKDAIRHAWQHAEENDIVVVAGKGHEEYLEINNQRLAYNEREYVKTLISEGLS